MAISSALTADAQIDWNNDSGVSPWFNLDANWLGGIRPNSTQTARFSLAGEYMVWWDESTVSQTPDIGFLRIENGSVTFLNNSGNSQHQFTINGSGNSGSQTDFSISGSSTSLTIQGMNLKSLGGGQLLNGATLIVDGTHAESSTLSVIGGTGFDISGNLSIRDGALLETSEAYIGSNPASIGNATVTGSESLWNSSQSIIIGFNGGNGSLSIQNSGTVRNHNGIIGAYPDSSGTVTISGAGSHWETFNDLYVGYYGGNGELNVNSGAKATSRYGWISNQPGTNGIATVTGPGSRWDNVADLHVGYYGGNGILNVTNEGSVSTENMFIGYGSGNSSSNNGTLNVSNGHLTIGTNTFVGYGSTGNGSLHISNQGTASQENLYIGFDGGTGNLTVSNGAIVTNQLGYVGFNRGSEGNVTVSGAGSQWNTADQLFLGWFEGSGNLTIDDGGTVSSRIGYIAYQPEATSIATVTGNNSKWTSSSQLFVGYLGDGTLNINDGGSVSTTYLHVQGELDIRSGGKAVVASNGDPSNLSFGLSQIGQFNNIPRYGTATVSGAESQWITDGRMQIDYGSLVVEEGGLVTSNNAYIGVLGPDGILTVTGESSRFELSRTLFTGNSTITVENGGTITSNRGVIGGFGGMIEEASHVKISGNGSQLTVYGNLSIGSGDPSIDYINGIPDNAGDIGIVTVSDEAKVNTLNSYLGPISDSRALVHVSGSGSHWNNLQDFYVGGTNIATGGTAEVKVSDSGIISVGGTTKIWSGGNFIVESNGILDTDTLDLTLGSIDLVLGGMLQAKYVLGDLRNESGVLSPGQHPSTTEVSGNYTQELGGTLRVTLGGAEESQFDKLIVLGDVSWAGQLDVSLLNGFSLSANQIFQIVTVGGNQSGTFSGLNEGALVGNFGGRDLFITYGGLNGEGVSLFTAVPEPSGCGLICGILVAFSLCRRRHLQSFN